MGKQVKLGDNHRERLREAASGIMFGMPWSETPEGCDYWESVRASLFAKATHGTSDGQPWREAEAKPESESEPIADVVCMIDPDNCEAVYIDGNLVISSETVYLGVLAREVEGKVIRLRQFKCDNDRQWPELLSDLDCKKVQHIAAYEPPIEAEFEVVADVESVIDDKWAAVWPRRWVMARDYATSSWSGPYRLLGFGSRLGWPYCCDVGPFKQVRPAAAEEIATVEPSVPAKPGIGEGYREAMEADSHRPDREAWCGLVKCWGIARLGIVMEGVVYRVPIDREPTAEDAKDQPHVMAWNEDGEKPILAKFLNRVDDRSRPFICCDGIRIIDAKFARHLRSYE